MKYLLIVFLAILSFYLGGCLFSDNPPHPEQITEIDSLNQMGSSFDRFTIVGNYLYVVSNSTVSLYNIQNLSVPTHINDVYLGNMVQSIRPYADSLLVLGEQTGLSLNKPTNTITNIGDVPSSQYYDPFVYKNNTIYLLESSGYVSSGYYHPDELSIFNLKSLTSAITDYRKNLYFPKDLSIDSSNNLFICDSGLKVFDASNDTNINLTEHFNIEANKITAYNDNLFILGNTGLYQYQYSTGQS